MFAMPADAFPLHDIHVGFPFAHESGQFREAVSIHQVMLPQGQG